MIVVHYYINVKRYKWPHFVIGCGRLLYIHIYVWHFDIQVQYFFELLLHTSQVEIYVEVDQVEPIGVSASTRVNITATATTDEASVMYTLVRQLNGTPLT